MFPEFLAPEIFNAFNGVFWILNYFYYDYFEDKEKCQSLFEFYYDAEMFADVTDEIDWVILLFGDNFDFTYAFEDYYYVLDLICNG